MPSFCETGLKFVWKIENFSHLKGEGFFSPPIYLNEPWVISITRGNSDISVYLHNYVRRNMMFSSKSYSPKVCCTFSFLSYDGTPLICKEDQFDSSNQNFQFIKNTFIFPNEGKFFPHDTLRVEFCMWLGDECGAPSPLSQFVCTQKELPTEVIQKRYCFNISQVIKSQEPIVSVHNETICNGQDLDIKINLPSVGQISVEFSSMLFGFQAKIRVCVLDSSGKEVEFGNHDAKVTSENPSFTFNLNISKSVLLSHSNKFLPSSNLSLVFICKFFGNFFSNRFVNESEIFQTHPPNIAVDIKRSESNSDEDIIESIEPKASTQPKSTPKAEKKEDYSKVLEKSIENETNNVSQALQDMLREGYFSDFTLKVEDRTFLVHKNVLGVRSKVFRSMFASEIEDNCVDIKDIDLDTLERMLKFIYSDKIDKDLDWVKASSLYAAADLYVLEPLKQGCSTILKNKLSIESALGVLTLADLHQDQQLKSAVLDFISLNDHDIIGTEDWIRFEEEQSKLVVETFRELYSRKMKK